MNIYDKDDLSRFELLCDKKFENCFNPLKAIKKIVKYYLPSAEICSIFRHQSYDEFAKDKRNMSILFENLFIVSNGVKIKIDISKQKELMKCVHRDITEEFKRGGVNLNKRKYIDDVSILGLSVSAFSSKECEIEIPEYLIPFADTFKTKYPC